MLLICPRFRNCRRLQAAAQNAPSLRRGETSDGVAVLQQALVHLGYLMPRSEREDDFDGIYGSETVTTVRHFQLANRLMVDGIAGKQTLTTMDQIFSINDPYYGEPIAERIAFLQQLNGPPGFGSTTCTTARKNRNKYENQ